MFLPSPEELKRQKEERETQKEAEIRLRQAIEGQAEPYVRLALTLALRAVQIFGSNSNVINPPTDDYSRYCPDFFPNGDWKGSWQAEAVAMWFAGAAAEAHIHPDGCFVWKDKVPIIGILRERSRRGWRFGQGSSLIRPRPYWGSESDRFCYDAWVFEDGTFATSGLPCNGGNFNANAIIHMVARLGILPEDVEVPRSDNQKNGSSIDPN